MADEIGKLLTNEDSNSQIRPAVSQEKLRESKKRLNGICRSLLIDTGDYEPKRTANSVNAYIASTEKVDRILYSVISGFIVGLDEKSRGIFSTNVDKLLQYVLDEENQVSEDTRKICIKLYDHFQLNLIQIESASVITKAGIATAMKDEIEESHKEIKGIQKEYITILGIFAAIMLTFVGTFTFSTSVLNNLGNADTLELVATAIVIGLVFVLLISILIDFLREINDKIVYDKNGKKKWNKKVVCGISILALVAVVTVICIGISRMSFPQQITIGQYRYQLVEEPVEDSEKIMESDSRKFK